MCDVFHANSLNKKLWCNFSFCGYANISLVLYIRRQLLLTMLVEVPKKFLTKLHVKVCFENVFVAFCIGMYCTINLTDLSFRFLNDMAYDVGGWVGLVFAHVVYILFEPL